MTSDQTSLEAQLRELKATPLDDAFLTRLEEAADGTLTQLTHEEIRFEAFLRGQTPSRLPADFMARLEAVVQDVPFAVDEKIVVFPKAINTFQPRRHRPMWGAAAAVALIGAATALMMPAGKPARTVADRQVPAPSSIIAAPTGNFVPAGFDRGLSEVRDEGIIWKSNKEPQNVVRVVYKDKITLRDETGRTFQVEQPRVEYLMVPAKTD